MWLLKSYNSDISPYVCVSKSSAMTQQVMQQQHDNDIHVAFSTTNLADIEAKLRNASDKYLYYIAEFLAGHINETKDIVAHFNGPILKASIKSIFWIFLLQYAILAMLGIGMNIAIIGCCLYHRFYRDVTQAFIINLALCHFVQCAVVLPITLMVMMIQNWIFGQFLCFFLPMLQVGLALLLIKKI
uniref:G-protein coupled receptors family 1 profile domain-containing protein n=1 Tax=Glossina austeni TaxID=7395 RepID=A0A1A9VD73_GLOAU